MLVDKYGRRFTYLRLSITDFCNFRCTYCLPDGYQASPCKKEPLSLAEITNLLAGFRALGFDKVRITGGEPTTRKDVVDIIRHARELGFEKVAMTTNGYRLGAMLPALKEAGLTNLNVSIDSLDEQRFDELTGRKLLAPIKAAVEQAIAMGFSRVKVNAVMIGKHFWEDLRLFEEWVRDLPLSVRFIELMQTVGRPDFFRENHLSGAVLREHLVEKGYHLVPRSMSDGPAQEFVRGDLQGSIGLIAPYSKDFCSSCNRLRVTSEGALKLCLFGNENYSLRDFLQSPDQAAELRHKICALLGLKDEGHRLHDGDSGATWSLSAMGG